MKKIILGTALLLGFFCASAQSDKYLGAMKANIAGIEDAFKDPQKLLSLSNSFERIGNAEKNQWLPYYYAAFLQVNYGFMLGDKVASGGDAVADKANSLLSKADSLSPANSEISCVKAMVATLSMIVNPMQRYMEYGPLVEQNLEAAKIQDPNNPRPYYLKAMNTKNTPEQFGGGCSAAKDSIATAKEKYATFKPASELSPSWGSDRLEKLIEACK